MASWATCVGCVVGPFRSCLEAGLALGCYSGFVHSGAVSGGSKVNVDMLVGFLGHIP